MIIVQNKCTEAAPTRLDFHSNKLQKILWKMWNVGKFINSWTVSNTT